MQRIILRALFCLFALAFVFSIFTINASLQTNTATNAATAANANSAVRRSPTPRVSSKKSNQALANNPSKLPDYLPAPSPTPPANSTLRGRVFYSDTGRAVKRASVMLMSDGGNDGPGSAPSAITDGEGNFQMKNVRGGGYYAIVNAPGLVSPLAFFDFSAVRNGRSEREAFAKAFEGFEKIVVNGVTDLDVQIPAQRGGAIGGRIMYDDGDAAIGVKVEILRKVEDKYMSVIPNFSALFSMRTSGIFLTDDRGVYRFSGLPPGEYIVKASENATHSENREKNYYDPFESSLGTTSYLTVFYPDALESKAAQILNLDYGQEIPEINLTIPSRSLFKLEGRIVSRNDKSTVRARISLSRETDDQIFSVFDDLGRRRQPSVTDENGVWKFKELPKGVYKMTIEPIAGENEYQAAIGNYTNTNAVTDRERNAAQTPKFAKKVLTVTLEDKDLTEMVIDLGSGATVSGTVSIENSQENPRSVTVHAISTEGEISVSDTVSNYATENFPSNSNTSYTPKPSKPDREFKLENVTEGKNHLQIFVGDDDYYVKSATLGGVDLLAAPFAVKEGENLRNVQIVLGKDVGTLKGKVVNEAKEFAEGVSLLLVPTDGRRKNSSFFRNARTDENGEFETKLAPGEYALVFFEQSIVGKNSEQLSKLLDQLIKEAQTVKIEAGRTENLTVTRKK